MSGKRQPISPMISFCNDNQTVNKGEWTFWLLLAEMKQPFLMIIIRRAACVSLGESLLSQHLGQLAHLFRT